MNIYEKLSAITNELQTVAKNLTVQQTQNSSYKAVSERDILDAVKPIENKYKVYSYPFSRDVVQSEMLESENTYNGKTTKKTTFFSRIRTVYRFVNIEKPEEYIDTTVYSEGVDTQDKGSGKAMTYADKYALMKAYKISTGDDPDTYASAEEAYKRAEKAVKEKMIDAAHAAEIDALTKAKGVTYHQIAARYKVRDITELTMEQACDCIRGLKGMPDVK